MEEDKNLKYYKLGNTIQEFEEIFGNVPIDDIDKIKKYLFENYIPTSLVKEKIEELKQKAISYGTFIDKDESFNIQSKISVLQDILERSREDVR